MRLVAILALGLAMGTHQPAGSAPVQSAPAQTAAPVRYDSVNATIGSSVPPPTVTLSASPGAAQDYTFDGENINLN